MQHFCIEGIGLGQKVDELEKVTSLFFDSVSGDIFNYAVRVVSASQIFRDYSIAEKAMETFYWKTKFFV